MVRLGLFALCLGLLSSRATAAGDELNRRQNSAANTNTPSRSATIVLTSTGAGTSASGSTITPAPASGSGSAGSSVSGGNGGNTEWTNGAFNSSSSASQTIDVDPRDPAGGVSLMTPAALSGSQYFKIGDYVTFVWNYTSLSVTPTAVDILVTGNANLATYTLATNQTFEPTHTVLWDTSQFTGISVSLLTQIYTLIVHDSDKEANAIASPGFLATFNQYKFGMYVKQPYVELGDFRCVTCNAGSRTLDVQALRFTMAMGIVTALSFVWFIAGIF